VPTSNITAGSTPDGSTDCPCPEPPARMGHRSRGAAPLSELGIEARAFRPDTGLSAPEVERARVLIKKLLRRKRDLLPPGAKLPEPEKEATYAEAARVMSRRLRREVSYDSMRLVAARSHGPNPDRKKHGAGLTARHHALLRAEAEATEQHVTEVLRHILDGYFEDTPEA
jgi:hypothetical protein